MLHAVHAVVVERRHAAHAVVDVVAVNPHKQHHHGRDRCPEDFQRQIAFDRCSIAAFTGAATKAHQAVKDEAHDPDEQDRADAEQHAEELVVHRRVGAGIHGQKIHVLPHPQPKEHEGHAGQQRENGGRDPHSCGFECPTLWTISGVGLPPLTFAAIGRTPVRD